MTKNPWNSKSICACLLMLAAAGILLRLGFWQLERLEWKTGVLKAIEAQKTIDPLTVSLAPLSDDAGNDLRRGYVRGAYKADNGVRIGPRMQDGKLGYWIVTPLVLSDGSYVLVNRGWADETHIQLLQKNAPKGIVTVTGSLRQGMSGKTPANEAGDYWHQFDVAAIAGRLALADMHALGMFAETSDPKDDERLQPVVPFANMRNEHRNYAIFWFTMAGVVLAGLAAFVVRTSLPKRH